MKFKAQEFYMHKDMKDVCIEVLVNLDQTLRHNMLQVRYWNLGYMGRPWLIQDTPSTIFIATQDIPDWVHLDYELLTTVRFADGVPRR